MDTPEPGELTALAFDPTKLYLFVAGPGQGEGQLVHDPDFGWIAVDGCESAKKPRRGTAYCLRALLDQFDVKRPKGATALDPDKIARERLDAFVEDNWPDRSVPFPRFFYDRRTVGNEPYLSLHAKNVVVDRARALVGSANFTGRAMARNIECGVLVEDAAFATRLAKQWMDLVSRAAVTALSVT